jgi:hypothetical protein
LDACFAQHWHFTPFAVSTDGLVGRSKGASQVTLSAPLRQMATAILHGSRVCQCSH